MPTPAEIKAALSDLDKLRCSVQLSATGYAFFPRVVTHEYCRRAWESARDSLTGEPTMAIGNTGRAVTLRRSFAPSLPGGVDATRMPGTGGTPQILPLNTTASDLGGQAGTIIGGSTGGQIGGLIGGVIDYFTGSGSEPPTGEQAVPGSFAPSGGGGCKFPAVQVNGRCVDPTAALPGGDPFVSPASGEAVYGRYGLAMTPRMETRTVSKCLPGMVLGKDGLCYESLAKGKRKWDPGTKPLLTGGEMNAINRAARAAKRLDRTKKKIKKAGRALEKAC